MEFVTTLIAAVEQQGGTIETTQEFEDAWSEECTSIANATLFPKTDSWIFGANILGKKHTVLFYLGGDGLVPRRPRRRPAVRTPRLRGEEQGGGRLARDP